MIQDNELIYKLGNDITYLLSEHFKNCSGCLNCVSIKEIYAKIPVSFDKSEYIEAFWECIVHDKTDIHGTSHGCEYPPDEQYKCIWCGIQKIMISKYSDFDLPEFKLRWYETEILNPLRSHYFNIEKADEYAKRKEGYLKYRKKPLIVEAIQMDEDFLVETLEGTMKGKKDDYLIIGIMGEKYPCTKIVFEESYDLVEEDD